MQIVAYRKIQQRVNLLLSSYQLGSSQWVILGYLYKQRTPWRFTDIAEMLQVENPLVSRLMQPLAKQKLISVTIGQKDKRIRHAAITKKGCKLVEYLEVLLHDHMANWESGLNLDDSLLYVSLIEKIAMPDTSDQLA